MTELKHPRVVADRKGWEALREEKLAPCRVCGTALLIELHHLVARSLGGDDVAANLVPLCGPCHRDVEEHVERACKQLGLSLTDAELAYITVAKYAGYADQRYGGRVAA